MTIQTADPYGPGWNQRKAEAAAAGLAEVKGRFPRLGAGHAFFRKKPVVIEARQLVDDLRSHTQVANWINANGGTAEVPFAEPCIFILTLEGRMRADIGDWIIKGVQGEFYPCKPDIFEATYEAVS